MANLKWLAIAFHNPKGLQDGPSRAADEMDDTPRSAEDLARLMKEAGDG
jgi:hypothetical protein